MSWEQRVEKSKNALTKEEVILTIEKDLGTSDFELIDYTIKPASENPLGFLGDHMRMKVNVKIGNKPQEKNYFVKKIPTEVPEHLEYALKCRAFYKEIEMYKTVFNDLKLAQKDPKNITKWCPDFYYSRGDEIFVLEDISLQGYNIIEERSLMDEDYVKATLRSLAAMHASSFVFEEKFNGGKIGHSSPEFKGEIGDKKIEIGEIYKHLIFESELSDEPGHPAALFYAAGVRSNPALIELLPGFTAEEKEKINKEFPKLVARMVELAKPSEKYKNVFIQADTWANNIMFRNGKNGEVKALLIDFQMARYGPPGQDVALLLNLTQSKTFLKEKTDELLQYYYDAFTKELAKNDLEAGKVLPWEIFVESYNYYYELGAIFTSFSLPVILIPSEFIGKFLSSPELFTLNMQNDRSELYRECYLNDELYRTRVTEALNDVIKRYIL